MRVTSTLPLVEEAEGGSGLQSDGCSPKNGENTTVELILDD